jgi:general secretion pathway protein G
MLRKGEAPQGEHTKMTSRRRVRRAFTLVEMVMVVMIVGMISSMAIPRISRGAAGAADVTLAADLTVVRKAILHFAAEHHGAFPGPSAVRFATNLTQYSDASGQVSQSRSASHPFGPYLHAIPPCPIGPNAGSRTVLIDSANSPPKADTDTGDGWVYNPNTGEFYANVAGVAQHGTTLDIKIDGAQALEIE